MKGTDDNSFTSPLSECRGFYSGLDLDWIGCSHCTCSLKKSEGPGTGLDFMSH